MKTSVKIENRELFFNRLKPYFPPSVMHDIGIAYMMAKFAHRAQTRKSKDRSGKPIRYFEHLRGVALILIDEVKIIEPDMVITALLHDSVEDTRDLTVEIIEHLFGPMVTSMIQTLSKAPKEGYMERFLLSNNWRTYVIKGCDRLHNLRSLNDAKRAFKEKQIKETEEHYFSLFDRMVELTPADYRIRATWLRDEVRRVTEENRISLLCK